MTASTFAGFPIRKYCRRIGGPKRIMSKPEPSNSSTQMLVPPMPLKADNTRLDFGFLADLALKTVYADANCTTERAADKLKLSMPVTEDLLQHLSGKICRNPWTYQLREQSIRPPRSGLAARPAVVGHERIHRPGAGLLTRL